MRALILGATGGIGRCLVEILSPHHQLFLVARERGPLAALAAQTESLFEAGDCRDFAFVEKVVERMKKEYGSCDAAANCIGSILLKPGHLTSESDYHETMDKNVKTAFALVRACAKAMMKSGGSVVLFSSAAAQIGMGNHEAIAAAKGAIESLTRAAAASYAPRGIRFNAIAPGLVDTPLAGRITKNQKSLEASIAMHPLGRIATPQEVAAAAAWFMEPEQAFITGQVLSIDGGLSKVKTRG